VNRLQQEDSGHRPSTEGATVSLALPQTPADR